MDEAVGGVFREENWGKGASYGAGRKKIWKAKCSKIFTASIGTIRGGTIDLLGSADYAFNLPKTMQRKEQIKATRAGKGRFRTCVFGGKNRILLRGE